MSDNLRRHDVWGDDPEERDASAVVEELLAQPGVARRWHDRPSIIWVKAVGRFVARNSKRVAVTIAGFAVLLAGVALLVLPGPGWLLIFIGLGILSTEYVWARRMLMAAKRKAEQARDAVLQRKNGRAERKTTRGDDGLTTTDDA
ncbi:MAG: PGPGW domain-containing protein [Actinomycetota bacterium]